MRFEVPQFIDIEDKIFGPLTWRQFLYLGGGVGMAVALFFINKLIFLIIGLPLGILAGALAFYKVNNRPFSFFLEAIVNFARGKRQYLWRKQSDIIHTGSVPKQSDTPYVSPQEKQPTRKKKDIASLSRRLELQALQKTEQ